MFKAQAEKYSVQNTQYIIRKITYGLYNENKQDRQSHGYDPQYKAYLFGGLHAYIIVPGFFVFGY